MSTETPVNPMRAIEVVVVVVFYHRNRVLRTSSPNFLRSRNARPPRSTRTRPCAPPHSPIRPGERPFFRERYRTPALIRCNYHSGVPARDDRLVLMEELEPGPYEHKPPFDDPLFERFEPHSGIRLAYVSGVSICL
jgi:hypothetical protein